MSYEYWTDAEMSAIRRMYADGPKAVAQVLGSRSIKAISRQAAKMGLTSKQLAPFTPAEDAVIRAHYFDEGAIGVAKMLDRTEKSVAQRAWRINVKSGFVRGRRPCDAVKRKLAQERLPGKGALLGAPIINSETKVTIAAPFVDRRFTPDGPVQRVVDPDDCRDWARAALA